MWVVGILIAIIAFIILMLSFYMLNYSLTPSRESNDTAIDRMRNETPWVAAWTDSLISNQALCDTFITHDDGSRMHAWWVQAQQPTHRVAVIVHGYKRQALSMLKIGYMFHHELGYNILLPDLAAHGQSDGDAIGMGWHDRLNVLQWADAANNMFRGDSTMTDMVVLGISMGAATVMCASGEPQPPYIKAYIEDCGYTNVWDEFASEAKNQFGISEFPLLYTTSALCKLRYGWSFGEASPLKQVAKCKLPMLFIHGDNDSFVPTWMVKPLYQAKPQPKQLWLTPDAEHDRSYNLYPQQYTDHVRDFLRSCGL